MQRNGTLDFHLDKVLRGFESVEKNGPQGFEGRRFENAFQSITRMILSEGFDKMTVNGKDAYDFRIFRRGKKHLIALYDEIIAFVNFVKDAAEGGSSKEMAFALIGEPGNAKTFFVDSVCDLYRDFVSKPSNHKFTFQFTDLNKLGNYGSITEAESQTFEDPMILAINLFGSTSAQLEENKEFLSRKGFSDPQIRQIFRNYRCLGACSDFILNQIREYADGNLEKMLEMIRVVPVSLSPTRGNLTGKYAAKDKITSSATDLIGEESIPRMLQISNTNNPYIVDLRKGALARVAGGGIHFADELFKNKPDLINVYLGVIQNRQIQKDGFIWPIDTLIIATSNNDEYNRFKDDGSNSPIISRTRHIYMSHNTNYLLQRELTAYALGDLKKTTFAGEDLHEDPLLKKAVSDIFILSRMPENNILSPEEMRKLCAGEIAGEKTFGMLAEAIEELSHHSDITKRFGQKGLEHRAIGKLFQILLENPEAHEGKCMTTLASFDAAERVIRDYVQDEKDQARDLEMLEKAKMIYRKEIKKEIFNAYMDEKDAIKRCVLDYINMVVALGTGDSPSNIRTYPDPVTKKMIPFKVNTDYVESVESRLGLKTEEQRDSFRADIRSSYARNIQENKDYDFMDNLRLVEAVTDVRLNSNVNSAKSLIGALSNRTNDENNALYERMIGTMSKKLGFCKTCSEKTLEYYCTHQDDS